MQRSQRNSLQLQSSNPLTVAQISIRKEAVRGKHSALMDSGKRGSVLELGRGEIAGPPCSLLQRCLHPLLPTMPALLLRRRHGYIYRLAHQDV